MADTVAGPSRSSAPPMSRQASLNGDRSRSPSVADSTVLPDKGKGVERTPLTIIPLPQTAMLDGATDPSTSTPISPWRPFSPRPRPPSPSYIVRSASPVKRPRPPIKYDSSDPDHISQAPLPAGRLRTPSPPPPPVKKLKPTGPPPLPEGPSTVQTLHVLLHPEHVEQNRPRRFFDYVRPRDTRKAQVVPSPGELRDILEKMKKVNEIWLRMMGEDETCLGCLAMWLKQFINNPKVFEGSVVPLLWVILRAKPSNDKMRAVRLHTLAKQALAQAERHNLANRAAIEQAVLHLDKLVEMGRQAKASGSGDGSESKANLPSFKKNVSAQPTSAAAANTGPSTSTRAPTIPTQREMTALEKILAASTAASLAKERATKETTAGPSTTNGRPPPPAGGAPISRLSNGSGDGSSATSGFRAAPGPVPMSINRTVTSETAGPSAVPAYPSPHNRWSSIATPAGRARTWDEKKKPNWRNHTIRYRDGALAEARPFEMGEHEAEEPDWWIYGTKATDAHGHSTSELDQEEGHTMRHLAHGGPEIEWYEPIPYETTNSTVGPVVTSEVQAQDARERGLLSTYYASPRDIPPSPEETNRFVDFVPYRSLIIPPSARAWIPPPQPMPYHLRQNPAPAYPPRSDPAPVPVPAPAVGPPSSSSSFRPRNGAATTPAGSSSSAYRPRAGSAPAGPSPAPEQLPRRASTPGPSGPPAPKPKQWLPPSGNPQPLPDRAGTNHTWSRQARPRKSALLNPLTAAQVAQNLSDMASAPPQDYSRFTFDDHEGTAAHPVTPPSQSRGGASKQ